MGQLIEGYTILLLCLFALGVYGMYGILTEFPKHYRRGIEVFPRCKRCGQMREWKHKCSDVVVNKRAGMYGEDEDQETARY